MQKNYNPCCDFSHGTKDSASIPRSLSPDGFPPRPEGAGNGTDTRLGRGPWGRTSPGTLENKAHPQTGSVASGENHSVFPLLPLLHPDPGGGAQETQGRGSFAPLYSDGKVKQGEFRDHQHQLKSRHFSPTGPPGKTSPSPHNVSREAKT